MTRVAPDSPRTAQLLARMLNDPNPDVRGAAGVSLNMLGDGANRVLGPMKSMASTLGNGAKDPRAAALCAQAIFRAAKGS
jgi:hypothetical protein